jgi:hypothetical protein
MQTMQLREELTLPKILKTTSSKQLWFRTFTLNRLDLFLNSGFKITIKAGGYGFFRRHILADSVHKHGDYDASTIILPPAW